MIPDKVDLLKKKQTKQTNKRLYRSNGDETDANSVKN